MKKDEFVNLLDFHNHSHFTNEDGYLVIDANSTVNLDVETLPDKIIFANNGMVVLNNLRMIDGEVSFKNNWNVRLKTLSLCTGKADFENKGDVYLGNLQCIDEHIAFNNGGCIHAPKLSGYLPYQGRLFEVRNIASSTYLFAIDEITNRSFEKARVFSGGPIDQMPVKYIEYRTGGYVLGSLVNNEFVCDGVVVENKQLQMDFSNVFLHVECSDYDYPQTDGPLIPNVVLENTFPVSGVKNDLSDKSMGDDHSLDENQDDMFEMDN